MDNKMILMIFVAIIIGMLVANMFMDVCGCKVVEGNSPAMITFDNRGCLLEFPEFPTAETWSDDVTISGVGLQDGVPRPGNISQSLEFNAFQFNTTAGNTYAIDTDGTEDFDTYLSIFNASGVAIIENDDDDREGANTYGSYIKFTAGTPLVGTEGGDCSARGGWCYADRGAQMPEGNYYAVVKNATGEQTGTYTISIDETPSSTPPIETPSPPTCPANFQCGAGFTIVSEPDSTVCAASGCTPSDCCVPSCYAYSCPAPLSQIQNPEETTCTPGPCTPSDCCVSSCANFTCTDPSTLVSDAANTMCAADTCTPAECCVLPYKLFDPTTEKSRTLHEPYQNDEGNNISGYISGCPTIDRSGERYPYVSSSDPDIRVSESGTAGGELVRYYFDQGRDSCAQTTRGDLTLYKPGDGDTFCADSYNNKTYVGIAVARTADGHPADAPAQCAQSDAPGDPQDPCRQIVKNNESRIPFDNTTCNNFYYYNRAAGRMNLCKIDPNNSDRCITGSESGYGGWI